MTREFAIDTAARYFDTGSFARDLAELVGFETESQTPDKAAELPRYLEQALVPRLSAIGFTCNIHPNPAKNAGPILVAERIEDEALPTILSYGHGDVIRAQTDQWRDGLHPFQLVDEGDRLYGRGTADNKGQHLINIAALGAVIEVRGSWVQCPLSDRDRRGNRLSRLGRVLRGKQEHPDSRRSDRLGWPAPAI